MDYRIADNILSIDILYKDEGLLFGTTINKGWGQQIEITNYEWVGYLTALLQKPILL